MKIRLVVISCALLALPAFAAAQQGDGFLFHAPRATLGMRASFQFARAGSGIFDFVTQQLTLNRRDFDTFGVAGDLGVNLSGPLDLVLSGGYSGTTKHSEFRDFVDQDNLPISQRTSFTMTPLTGALRLYLLPRGHSVSRFAWIPARFSPYVGAGGGMVHYTFKQVGSFVDFQDLSVFDETLRSSGWTPLGMIMAGMDFSVGPRVVLTTDARYQWASANLDQQFVSFADGIDLSGLQLSMGVHFRL